MSVIGRLLRTTTNDSPKAGALRILPNMASVAFGLAGLSEVWRVAAPLLGVPVAVADVILAIAAAVWLAHAAAYFAQGWRTLAADWHDPVLAPFLALVVITPMLLASGLSHSAFAAGRVLVVVFLVLTAVVAALMMGDWIVGRLDQDCIHPGYFLPSVAGGFVGAYAAWVVHLTLVAEVSFGMGVLSWLLLGSNVMYRLFFRPTLPPMLLPTLAIEVAPPTVAGVAWFAISGGSTGLVSRVLAGYAIFMVLVQIRLVPVYARLRFSVGFWSFSFAYSALAADAMLWIALGRPSGATAWAITVLALITLLDAAIAARSILAIARGEFFPRSGLPSYSEAADPSAASE